MFVEIVINGKNHGALSWYFAQALLTGKADINQNGYLERAELERIGNR